MNGFLLVDKPAGWTSSDVVSYLKKKFNLHKCGHTGTLDPQVTGLLVVGCNQATKLMKYLNEHDKEYLTTICFGYDSTTLDWDGTITEELTMNVDQKALDQALAILAAKTEQIPPLVSAIKVNGKKLYDYQRKNESVSVLPRPVFIRKIETLSDLYIEDGHAHIDLRIVCSKGFYVRAFARDLGQLMGGKAIMKRLRRIQSGFFSLEDAKPLKEITEDDLLPIQAVFPDFATLYADDFLAHLVYNGVVLDERQIQTDKPFYIVHKNVIIAIYEVIGHNRYKPLVIFKENR